MQKAVFKSENMILLKFIREFRAQSPTGIFELILVKANVDVIADRVSFRVHASAKPGIAAERPIDLAAHDERIPAVPQT